MSNFLLTGRNLLITLIGLYIIYIAYIGYTLSNESEKKGNKKYSQMFISLGVIGSIMVLYSVYLLYRS